MSLPARLAPLTHKLFDLHMVMYHCCCWEDSNEKFISWFP